MNSLLILLFICININICCNGYLFEYDENFVKLSSEQYFKLLLEKSDWFDRLFKIIRIELEYRRTKEGCIDNCYDIKYKSKYDEPIKNTVKRSIFDRKIHERKEFDILKWKDPIRSNVIKHINTTKSSNTTNIIRKSTDSTIKMNLTTKVNNSSTNKPVINLLQVNTTSNKSSTTGYNITKFTTITTQSSTRISTTKKLASVSKLNIHISRCTNKYRYYCLNGGVCKYIIVLKEPFCNCQVGFSGKRCNQFSLKTPATVFGELSGEPLNIGKLNFKKLTIINSTLKATALFTYRTAKRDPKTIHDIMKS